MSHPAGVSPDTPDRAARAFVHEFSEGSKEQKRLLGGKGANLAEMTNLGLPVPPGFTISTEACRYYLAEGHEPPGLADEVDRHLARLEAERGKRLGAREDPLLVSVRSGAMYSMPGMMDTVLDIGLHDGSVAGLAAESGDERFAWDSYRRLIQMFGKTVLGIDGGLFDAALDRAKRDRGVRSDLGLGVEDLRELVAEHKAIVRDRSGREFPQDAREQVDMAVRAVFESWNTDRARAYRRQERIPHDLGTAVNVMAMVYGNLGPDSGTGVAFTRDPATGRPGVYGDYLRDAQGEDVVAGIRNTVPLQELEDIDKHSYDELMRIMARLEGHYKDLCDIEFTIERGKLWMLQTRVGKRTAAAAFRMAAQLVDDGVIDLDEALRRVTGAQLAQLMFPQFDRRSGITAFAHGVPASPGAAVGAVVFDSAEAVARDADGERVILVRQETSPDDLPGMLAADGILTSRGGKTSHAAVVARGMGKTCVVGAEDIAIDLERRRFTGPGVEVGEGDVISVDGTTGAVYRGEIAVVPSPVMRDLESGRDGEAGRGAEGAAGGAGEEPGADGESGVVHAVRRLMRHADDVRRLAVHANADTPEDAARARRFGAHGIGLCRTEHMFLGERRRYVEDLILAESQQQRDKALEALLPLQRDDFTGILEAMDGLPVTIRLIDPPLHEFLPDLTGLAVKVAVARERGAPDAGDLRLLQAVRKQHEQNPMLGLRGVRLGLVVPGLVAMQVRAVAEAAVARTRAGGTPRPEIMVPLVGGVEELELLRTEIDAVLADVRAAAGVDVPIAVGTMIELPRAALTAGRIATVAEFFSFGTNDLTQTTWGFSRDDVEGAFFPAYLDKGVFTVSPFEALDEEGVGRLIEIAVAEGRAARPGLVIGVCGEHGGDPSSVRFFDQAGLDYVSCSPYRVPVARLEAGRSAVTASEGGSDTR
ncbi:pyruvate, phosphate dikinase [Myceligenerans xiligouense]|uniref:Pyruvate, phosphate dikinase n=1 Tax=Myceligenerans xiligouense TaxID=253184 RepID=A0A3N4ZQS8_9MICO|nr:pyruvate, phosphate dikinase [Myceligenerans xiligouense]RPF22201.1 pyruvate phosphate dikinase [Myceligenerans xiligouense]